MERAKHAENRILTIPNMLSFFRICLIPFLVRTYWREEYRWTAGILLLSGITDICDGYIARRFNMVSNLGKILDPIADKLTQGVMLLCLSGKYTIMLASCTLLVIKEAFVGITGMIAIKKSRTVHSSDWHGKIVTWLLYIVMFIHLIWKNIPYMYSCILVVICLIMMLISLILYGKVNLKVIKEMNQENVIAS